MVVELLVDVFVVFQDAPAKRHVLLCKVLLARERVQLHSHCTDAEKTNRELARPD